MNPYLIIAFFIAVLGAGAGGFKLGVDHEIAAKAREEKHIAEAVDAANTAAAQAIAKIKVTNSTIEGEVRREVQTNTIYADCRHSANGLQLINQALTNSSAASDSKLPKPDTAK